MTDIGTLGGLTSYARKINDQNEVVGSSSNAMGESRAFLYTSINGMIDLNTLLPPDSGWELRDARSINNNRQIVGTGYFEGVPKSFILNY